MQAPVLHESGRGSALEVRYPTPSIPSIDPAKERWGMYMLKRHGLPWMYWNLMLKGTA